MSTDVTEPISVRPLQIGPLRTETPVVLAPMAGVTDPPFRLLCQDHGAAVLVSEMTGARALVEGNDKTQRMARFHPDELNRSTQLAGVDPATMAEAVRILVTDHGADHIDINFGCPMAKVTRKGGGAALPWRRALFGRIVEAAVRAAEPHGVPVTVKMRMGIDDEHLTFTEAGAIAVDAGAAAVALHARTAADLYGPPARWDAIGELVAAVEGAVPVLGNGDVWDASDAVEMVRQTGCDGVVVGRGCLGRPWLFGDLERAFKGLDPRPLPTLGEVTETMVRHAALLADWKGERDGVVAFRKHVRWYLQGFPVGGAVRRSLALSDTVADVDRLCRQVTESLGPDLAQPPEARRMKRGHTRGPQKVTVPQGWYELRDDPNPPPGTEYIGSGG